MSGIQSQIAAFYRDVARAGRLWTLKEREGAPVGPSAVRGRDVQPFWSSRSRVERLIETIPAWQRFEPQELSLADWEREWLPAMERHGVEVGANWSGRRARGFDVSVETAREYLRSYLENPED